jgi:hypothetical protein
LQRTQGRGTRCVGDGSGIKSRATRLLSLLQIGILCTFGYFAWRVGGPTVVNAVADWLIVVVGALGTVFQILPSREKPGQQLVVKV